MLGPHTVTLIHPAGRDGWGDVTAGDAEVAVSGCFWQPTASSELTNGQDTVTANARVFMPPSPEVAATDRIRFGGSTYEVQGQPALHYSPLGPHHYEVELRKVRG